MSNTALVERMVHEKGKRFYPRVIPEDIERGELGDCFDHCLLQALNSGGKYLYCEGMVYINREWIHHAWLTTKKEYVAYDPTWRALNEAGEEVPLPMVQYLGCVLDLDLVTQFVIRTEYKSPLANYQKNPELAQKIYDTAR